MYSSVDQTITAILDDRVCVTHRTAPGKTSTVPVSPAAPKSSLYRNTASRNTFHGGPIRDRRQRQYNGPDGLPTHSQDTSAMGQAGRMSFLNKLTSKFSRRYVIFL